MTAGNQGLEPLLVQRLLAGDGEAAAVLARSGAGQWVELKERLPLEGEIARELAAFANSGGGVLIMGVTNVGDAKGWRPADAAAAARRMQATADSVLPYLTHVRRGAAKEGWLAWTVVDPTDEPTITAEGTYWRRASNLVRSAELPPQRPAGYRPTSLSTSGPARVFVAMSFREEEEPALADYWQAMLRAGGKANRDFSLVRLDQVEGDYEIVDRIYQEIDKADLVIADLTLSPPNVYLEIGYARGRGKQVIQTCRDDTELEFDIRGRRTLRYRNAITLERKLLRELDAL